MAANGQMDAVMAGLVEGVGDARTTDPVILKAAVGFGKPLFGYRGDSVANAFGYLADTAKISVATNLVASNSAFFCSLISIVLHRYPMNLSSLSYIFLQDTNIHLSPKIL